MSWLGVKPATMAYWDGTVITETPRKGPKLSFYKHSYHQFLVQSLYIVRGLVPSVADAEIQLGLQYE